MTHLIPKLHPKPQIFQQRDTSHPTVTIYQHPLEKHNAKKYTNSPRALRCSWHRLKLLIERMMADGYWVWRFGFWPRGHSLSMCLPLRSINSRECWCSLTTLVFLNIRFDLNQILLYIYSFYKDCFSVLCCGCDVQSLEPHIFTI